MTSRAGAQIQATKKGLWLEYMKMFDCYKGQGPQDPGQGHCFGQSNCSQHSSECVLVANPGKLLGQ